VSLSQAELLASQPDWAAILAGLSDQQHAELQGDWDSWARPEQLLPAGECLTWLVLAGRGFGKTRLGAEGIRKLVCGSGRRTKAGHLHPLTY
jgi:phage terminase large subunit-like protein